METKELENKIKYLEARISRLEKIENKRETNRIIKIFIKVIIIIVILIMLWIGYNYVNNKYIKPYNEIIEEVKNTYSSVKDNDLSLEDILNKIKDKE